MKVNTKPLPGMMELLPEEQIEFERIMNVIKKHHARFGFSPVDTPIIERTETLLAKAGGETEKQIYRFKKGDNDLSLRFDLTVPTARFVAENFGHLQFPFKRSQIGKVYRGERAQRGRFREFYQCDIDIIGRDELNLKYDAEVILVIYWIFRELNYGNFKIRINNRKIIEGLLIGLDLTEKSSEIMTLIDKAEKISPEEFKNNLKELNIGEEKTAKIEEFINISGRVDAVIDQLKNFSQNLKNSDLFLVGVDELRSIAETLTKMGVEENFFKLDMLIVRGLDYYTGTVFETFFDDFKEIGSVSSGGRYDNLSEYYSKEKLPGVGASIGLTRLFWCLRDLGLISAKKRSLAEILIIPFSEKELEKSFEIANLLRENGRNVEILFDEMKIGKAFKFADKRGVDFVMAIGEKEITESTFELKNMQTGEKISLEDFLKK